MTWALAVLNVVALFVHIDAQNDPWATILAAVAVGVALWFIVAQARRRDERRAEKRRGGNDRQPRSW